MFSALRQQKNAHAVLIAAKWPMVAPGLPDSGYAYPTCQIRGLLLSLTRHHGAVNLKATRLGDDFMEAKGFIQHFRVRQEGVSHNTQFTPLFR